MSIDLWSEPAPDAVARSAPQPPLPSPPLPPVAEPDASLFDGLGRVLSLGSFDETPAQTTHL